MTFAIHPAFWGQKGGFGRALLQCNTELLIFLGMSPNRSAIGRSRSRQVNMAAGRNWELPCAGAEERIRAA